MMPHRLAGSIHESPNIAHKQMSWFEQLLEQHANIFPVTQEIAIKAGQLRGRFSSNIPTGKGTLAAQMSC